MLTIEELRPIQLLQLRMMDDIHRVCMENGIHYYMIGGTMLGAIRHKGFIPWDMDIDLAMCRSDYERFRELFEITLGDKYLYHDHLNTHNYNRPHAVVSIPDTLVTYRPDKYNKNVLQRGVALDIFPLDYAPDSEEEAVKHGKRIERIKLAKYYLSRYNYTGSCWKKVVRQIICGILFFLNTDRLNRIQQKVMRRYEHTPTKHLCSMASKYKYEKQYMSVDIYGDGSLYPFEGRMFYGPSQAELYLTRLYGDYMKLPSKENQKKMLAVFDSVDLGPFGDQHYQ